LLCLLGARPGCRGALLASSSPGDQRPSGCCAPWMAHNPGLRGFAAITTGLGLYQEGPVGENASCAPSKGPACMIPRCVPPCDRGPLCAAPGERTSACRGSNLWPDRGAKASHQGGSATLPHVQAQAVSCSNGPLPRQPGSHHATQSTDNRRKSEQRRPIRETDSLRQIQRHERTVREGPNLTPSARDTFGRLFRKAVCRQPQAQPAKGWVRGLDPHS